MSNSQKILKSTLKFLAKRTLRRFKPTVIGVTGSVGKTMAKEAIYAVLARKFKTRKNAENFNNEFGVPLTVLGVDPKISTANVRLANWARLLRFWGKLLKSAWRVFGPQRPDYPEILVLELASAKPGDIDYLVDIVHPSVGIVTAIGEIPVHVEFYAGPEEVALEKSKLISSLPSSGGFAVLNFDDKTVLDMKEITNAEVKTFGFSKEADIWASGASYFLNDDNESVGGISFKISSGETFVPFKVKNAIGAHQIYAFLAAISVGLKFGINMIDASSALEKVELPKGRMNLLKGIKNSLVIDDTYNASPLSMRAGIEALNSISIVLKNTGKTGRRVAVLGDMKELGQYAEQAHRSIGNLAGEKIDILVTVGAAAKFIADSAASQLTLENIISFSTSEEAASKVQEMVKEGDVILVKGSHSMQMEKVVDEIKVSG